MFYAWCLPCTLLSVDFVDSIQTQLNLWVHMMCINPSVVWARPYSASREKVWDMAIKQLVARYLISHVNPVMMSVMAITKVRLAIFYTRVLISTVFQLMTQDTSCSAYFSSNSLSTQT